MVLFFCSVIPAKAVIRLFHSFVAKTDSPPGVIRPASLRVVSAIACLCRRAGKSSALLRAKKKAPHVGGGANGV